MASSSKVPQPHGGHKYHKIYHLRDAVGVQYADRVSKLASRQSNAALGTPAYLATYPEALTTTVEGLSKEEKWGMQKLADELNEEGPLDEKKEKVGISFFQTAHFDLHLYPCIRNARNLPKVIKKFLADIKRTMGVQAFMMVGYIGKDEDPHSTM